MCVLALTMIGQGLNHAAVAHSSVTASIHHPLQLGAQSDKLADASVNFTQMSARNAVVLHALSWFGTDRPYPDARTIWLFREKLIRAGVIQALFDRLDDALRASGYIAMSGQIVDASLISAPKQRNTREENHTIKAGGIPEDWATKPAKVRHKDRDARWTVKFTKAKTRADGTTPPVDIAIPTFGYQNHASIDRGYGLIRKWLATDAASYEGARLRDGLLDKTNTASAVWADTAYRSAKNEAFLRDSGFVSRIHRKKPKGKPLPERTRKPALLQA